MLRRILLRWVEKRIEAKEKRAIKQSYVAPVVLSAGRDAVKIFSRGEVVVVEAEWMGGKDFLAGPDTLTRIQTIIQKGESASTERAAIVLALRRYFENSGSRLTIPGA